MGTRHLTIIKKDNDYKLIQYGQWDGYPSGQGVDLLSILHSTNIPTLRNNVDTLIPTSNNDIDTLTKESNNWTTEYPQFCRDTGTTIIQMIHNTPNLKVTDPKNYMDNMKPNVWIEYSYLIDFDKEQLELYQGTPLDHEGNPRPPDYSCDLNSLPTQEDFLLSTKEL